MELITSRRNPLVGRLRALHQPKGRREQGLLLLEGTHQLQELLRLGLPPEQVLATPAWIERNGLLLAEASLPLQPVGEEVMAAVATTDHPDGLKETIGKRKGPVEQGVGQITRYGELTVDEVPFSSSRRGRRGDEGQGLQHGTRSGRASKTASRSPLTSILMPGTPAPSAASTSRSLSPIIHDRLASSR